jgi:hypothetical protein
MGCANKLWENIFLDSNLAKKLPCGQTKAEASVKNVTAPRSVQGFIDVLKNPTKSSKFFFTGTVASNHKNRKIFPLVLVYFGPLSGVKNRLPDLTKQVYKTANAVHNLIKSSLAVHKLDIKYLTLYRADNANMNYGNIILCSNCFKKIKVCLKQTAQITYCIIPQNMHLLDWMWILK